MCSLSPYQALQNDLFDAGLLIPSGVPGIYGRSGAFESVTEGFERLVTQAGADPDAEVMRFPPIFNRAHYCQISHIHQFPDLLGSVHTFTGDGKDHRRMTGKQMDGEDWTDELVPADAMLIPAACYPLYPTATGTLPVEGRIVDLRSYVFRHEPSPDPVRMQIFRQREYVRLGTAEQVVAHRDMWLDRGEALLKSLGLPVRRELANDPFFGRGGRLAKATQREQELKYELVVPFDIQTADGQPAHSACISDVVIELLHGLGHEPIASLPFTLTIDFDVDQWTLFKFPHADIEALYGLGIHELGPWRPLATHVEEQVEAGRPVLVEDPELTRRLGTAGARVADARFDAPVMAQTYAQAFSGSW
ncbi:MAG: DUF1839 family protein [Proteobacteria bacterium]|nr:DUF1839 family protein [Pseudomonadota bacterium]MCP4921089.1 DUF1839 family protein [Pseudomonadota bacterium]